MLLTTELMNEVLVISRSVCVCDNKIFICVSQHCGCDREVIAHFCHSVSAT